MGRALKDGLRPGGKEAEEDAGHGQRHDEGVDAKDGDTDTVCAADHQPDQDAQ